MACFYYSWYAGDTHPIKEKIALYFELSILDFIQTHLRSTVLDAAMPAITALGNGGILWIGSAALLLLLPKTRKVGAAIAVSLLLEALCCNLILKPLVERVRPYDINSAVQLLIARPTDFSFPSGHTGASFAATAALYFKKSQLWIPAAVLSVLIAFSRLYLYVHYPSDVLAGAMLGIIAGWAGCILLRLTARFKNSNHEAAE